MNVSLHDNALSRTGRVLQALGNTRAAKEKQLEERGDDQVTENLWDEVLVMHTYCLKQYESTLGKFNHQTADACHKLAEQYILQKITLWHSKNTKSSNNTELFLTTW